MELIESKGKAGRNSTYFLACYSATAMNKKLAQSRGIEAYEMKKGRIHV